MATTTKKKIEKTVTEKTGGEIQREGYYVLLTGRNCKPFTCSFKIGRHGAKKGRLERAARFIVRQNPKAYEEGYRKAEVIHFRSGKGAEKTGVALLLEAKE